MDSNVATIWASFTAHRTHTRMSDQIKYTTLSLWTKYVIGNHESYHIPPNPLVNLLLPHVIPRRNLGGTATTYLPLSCRG